MLRFKAFRGSDVAMVEKQINAWLMQAEPDVKMMDQAATANGDLTVSFVYSEGFRASEERLTEEASVIVENALNEPTVLEPLTVDEEPSIGSRQLE